MLIFVIVRDHSAYVLRPHTIPNSPVRGIHRCPTGKAKVIPGGTTGTNGIQGVVGNRLRISVV
jgi:hypothetical protein